ncbi:hypothetical protein [Sphingomonas spermidinifaciens]|nr:hypothetical protein [Sphingomonas spermidinifaciens]
MFPMLLLSAAIGASACARANQRDTASAPAALPGQARVRSDQISPQAARTVAPLPAISPTNRSAGINQLPGNLEAREGAEAPESVLSTSAPTPDRVLHAEVLRTWNQLRQRGQQPTAELLAKEIGPEALARFLATYPGAERLFETPSMPFERAPEPLVDEPNK